MRRGPVRITLEKGTMLHTPHDLAIDHHPKVPHRPISDAEWAFLEEFVIENPRRPGRPPRNHRIVLDGIFWIACSGSPWRRLPEEFGNWGSVYRQFLRWIRNGLWEAVIEALQNTSQAIPQEAEEDALANIDKAYLATLAHEAQLTALRPRSTQGRPRTVQL